MNNNDIAYWVIEFGPCTIVPDHHFRFPPRGEKPSVWRWYGGERISTAEVFRRARQMSHDEPIFRQMFAIDRIPEKRNV